MPKGTKAERSLDERIGRLYNQHCAGTRISVLDIGSLYRDCRAAWQRGEDLETAVKAAIARYNV